MFFWHKLPKCSLLVLQNLGSQLNFQNVFFYGIWENSLNLWNICQVRKKLRNFLKVNQF